MRLRSSKLDYGLRLTFKNGLVYTTAENIKNVPCICFFEKKMILSWKIVTSTI